MRRLHNWILVVLVIAASAVIPFATPQPVSALTGSGTAEDPYMIYDVDDLQDMNLDLDAYYELASDIDASATATWNWHAGRGVYQGFAPVSPFNGHLDGNGYEITGLHINRAYSTTAHVGLFGRTTGAATISHVRILDAGITVSVTLVPRLPRTRSATLGRGQ